MFSSEVLVHVYGTMYIQVRYKYRYLVLVQYLYRIFNQSSIIGLGFARLKGKLCFPTVLLYWYTGPYQVRASALLASFQKLLRVFSRVFRNHFAFFRAFSEATSRFFARFQKLLRVFRVF